MIYCVIDNIGFKVESKDIKNLTKNCYTVFILRKYRHGSTHDVLEKGFSTMLYFCLFKYASFHILFIFLIDVFHRKYRLWGEFLYFIVLNLFSSFFKYYILRKSYS